MRVGLGLEVGLKPQYSHPVCMTRKTQAFMQQSIPRDSQECWEQEFHKHGKNAYGKFLDGNEHCTDVSNESVTQ